MLFTLTAVGLFRADIIGKKKKDASKAVSCDALTFQNVGNRQYQQDSLYISDTGNRQLLAEKGVLAVVADGMGGLQDGAEISRLVTDTFERRFREDRIRNPLSFLKQCVTDAEKAADDYLLSKSVKGGSTVVAALINGSGLYYVSVGDSSIFIVRGNEVRRVNSRHNYASVLQAQVKRGLITQAEADTHPMRLRITSFIGMGEAAETDCSDKPERLADGDVIIVCSDGVSDALGDNALAEVVSDGDFDQLGQRMEQRILDQNIKNQDNFSAVIVRIKGANQ